MYTLVANLETGDRSHAAAQPPTDQDDDNDSDVSSSSCQLGNADTKIMGEIYSILEPIEHWTQQLTSSESIEKPEEDNVETQDFLVDEKDILDIICTINRLVFLYVIVKWINLKMWGVVGGGSFAMNR